MTVTNYATGPDPFMVSLEWYEKLPIELRQIFDEVALESIARSDQMNRDEEQKFIDKLESELEINYLTSAELMPFRAKVKPVYDHFLRKGDFSQEDLEQARKATKGNDDA